MKVLAIRLARFGDLVLLLPALTAFKSQFPDCRLTLLTDNRWTPLAEMCPAIDEIISVDRIAMRDGKVAKAVLAIGRLARSLRQQKFDLTIDFHGFRETNLLTRWSGAPRRLGLQRFDQAFLKFCFNLPPVVEDKSIHVAEMFLRVVERAGVSAATTAPVLVVPETARQWARDNLPVSPVVLFMGGPVPQRIWPAARFAELADHIIRNLGAPVLAVAGLEQIDQERHFPAYFPERFRVLSRLPIPKLAAVIGSARLLVSNDTGPMHLGPALGIPTLGIFSVGLPVHFRPYGKHDRYVQKDSIESISAEEVIGVVDQMWANVG